VTFRNGKIERWVLLNNSNKTKEDILENSHLKFDSYLLFVSFIAETPFVEEVYKTAGHNLKSKEVEPQLFLGSHDIDRKFYFHGWRSQFDRKMFRVGSHVVSAWLV